MKNYSFHRSGISSISGSVGLFYLIVPLFFKLFFKLFNFLLQVLKLLSELVGHRICSSHGLFGAKRCSPWPDVTRRKYPRPRSVTVITHSGFKTKNVALLNPIKPYLCALVGEVTSGSC